MDFSLLDVALVTSKGSDQIIGVGRFRILGGGQGLEFWGGGQGGGGGKFPAGT